MWSEVFNNVLALVVGLFTGFYFERRATKTARREAEEAAGDVQKLQETIKNLRDEIYTRNAPAADVPRATALGPRELMRETLTYARENQDASGRIRSTHLRNGVAGKGFTMAEVDAAINTLVEHNSLLRDGRHWKVQA